MWQRRLPNRQGDYTIGWRIFLFAGGLLQLTTASMNVDTAPHAQRIGKVGFVEDGAKGGDAFARRGGALIAMRGIERNQVDVAQQAFDQLHQGTRLRRRIVDTFD